MFLSAVPTVSDTSVALTKTEKEELAVIKFALTNNVGCINQMITVCNIFGGFSAFLMTVIYPVSNAFYQKWPKDVTKHLDI
jgi:hypothetical protein